MPIKVAVVEDNRNLREGLCQILSGTPGFQCVGSSPEYSEQFLEKINTTRPDVIVMDIGLPKVSGTEFTRIIKQRYPEIKIMMLTVFEDERCILDSITAGASGYLLKKTPPLKILEGIQQIYAGEASMSGAIAMKVLQMFPRQTNKLSSDERLSEREYQVLKALVKGMSYKEIAESLFISVDTVRSHIRQTYEKLHVHSKSEAVIKALRHNLVH